MPAPSSGARRSLFLPVIIVAAAVAAGGAFALLHPERLPEPLASASAGLTGANPHPVKLLRPTDAPLSALAQIGRDIFYDRSLSASGKQSCASCHSPERAYGPPNGLSVQPGGAHMEGEGARPPPSLAYLYRQQPFSIGPDISDQDVPPTLQQLAVQAKGATRAVKVAGLAPAAPAMVPQGGLFWDGRSATLQSQATGPLLDPMEMANASADAVGRKLAAAPYAAKFVPLFGPQVLKSPAFLVSEAMSALARYQIEDPSFHRFDSKYDAWLEGRARFTAAEQRGFRLFNDRTKANCAGCHLSAAGKDGLPPLFTDTQYEALGLPRNRSLAPNRDPSHFDLGV
jgi:cytochrome c peroxidase